MASSEILSPNLGVAAASQPGPSSRGPTVGGRARDAPATTSRNREPPPSIPSRIPRLRRDQTDLRASDEPRSAIRRAPILQPPQSLRLTHASHGSLSGRRGCSACEARALARTSSVNNDTSTGRTPRPPPSAPRPPPQTTRPTTGPNLQLPRTRRQTPATTNSAGPSQTTLATPQPPRNPPPAQVQVTPFETPPPIQGPGFISRQKLLDKVPLVLYIPSPTEEQKLAIPKGQKWEDVWEISKYPYVALEEHQAVCPICMMDFVEPKKRVLSKKAGKAKASSEGSDEKPEPLRNLPCRHIYHKTCLDPWILSKSTNCPYCRIPIKA